MPEPQIRFNDGAAYERMMGVWSRSAGEVFLEWLAPRPSLRFVDVGCGNGAFTELLAERCTPKEIQGVDLRPRSRLRAHDTQKESRSSVQVTR